MVMDANYLCEHCIDQMIELAEKAKEIFGDQTNVVITVTEHGAYVVGYQKILGYENDKQVTELIQFYIEPEKGYIEQLPSYREN